MIEIFLVDDGGIEFPAFVLAMALEASFLHEAVKTGFIFAEGLERLVAFETFAIG